MTLHRKFLTSVPFIPQECCVRIDSEDLQALQHRLGETINAGSAADVDVGLAEKEVDRALIQSEVVTRLLLPDRAGSYEARVSQKTLEVRAKNVRFISRACL